MAGSRSSSLGVLLVAMMTMLSVTNCFEIFVKTITGKTLSLEAYSGSTIESVKLAVQHSEGIQADQQTLIGHGIIFKNEKTLAYYNITRGDTIQINLHLRGGYTPGDKVTAPDVEHETWTEEGSNKGNPLYTACAGLTYSGRCLNRECNHYRQLVSHHKRIQTGIDVLADVHQKNYGCPSCKQFFRMEDLCVSQCDARMFYKKCGNAKQGAVQCKEYTPRRKNIIEFGGRDNQGDLYQADYTLLKFDTYRIDQMPGREEHPPLRTNSQSKKLIERECVCCMNAQMTKACVPCGHLVVCDQCGDETLIRKLAGKCPQCRKPIDSIIKIYGLE